MYHIEAIGEFPGNYKPKQTAYGTIDDTNLSQILNIKVGARAMVVLNIDTNDSLVNAVRKIALCIMPKDRIQSFGHLLEDKPWLKREFKKLTSEFANNSKKQYGYKYICSRPKFSQANYRWFPKETIPKYLQKIYQIPKDNL